MTPFQLSAMWSFKTAFHIGTGLSGSGADRKVRSYIKFDDDEEEEKTPELKRVTIPEISGEALKGSVRGSAERIVRWLHPNYPPDWAEAEDDSIPRHPAIRRIFAWQSLGSAAKRPPSYRFSAPVYQDGGSLRATASTAINPERGVAEENTLRVIQQWSANAYFNVTISGRGGTWDDTGSRDYLDLLLLVVAFIATAQVGGKKGNGLGETAINGLNLDPVPIPVFDVATMERLRKHISETRD